MREIDLDYEKLRVENIKLKHALRSFVNAHVRMMMVEGAKFELTQKEAERIKLVKDLI